MVKEWKGEGFGDIVGKKADGDVFVVWQFMRDCSEEDSDIISHVHSEPHRREGFKMKHCWIKL